SIDDFYLEHKEKVERNIKDNKGHDMESDLQSARARKLAVQDDSTDRAGNDGPDPVQGGSSPSEKGGRYGAWSGWLLRLADGEITLCVRGKKPAFLGGMYFSIANVDAVSAGLRAL
ncbi:2273_t:CDS:2, partial [Acaulospora colombiana]